MAGCARLAIRCISSPQRTAAFRAPSGIRSASSSPRCSRTRSGAGTRVPTSCSSWARSSSADGRRSRSRFVEKVLELAPLALGRAAGEAGFRQPRPRAGAPAPLRARERSPAIRDRGAPASLADPRRSESASTATSTTMPCLRTVTLSPARTACAGFTAIAVEARLSRFGGARGEAPRLVEPRRPQPFVETDGRAGVRGGGSHGDRMSDATSASQRPAQRSSSAGAA